MRADISSTIVLCALLVTPAATATVIYVDPDSAYDGPGNDWEHAFHFLQNALAVAVAGDEIRVAQGTYRPDESAANPTGSGDRAATFQLINRVDLYGGYGGYGEPDPDARDIGLFQTILSGDLAEDDGPAQWQGYDENSYHVVRGSNIDYRAILDGFTITAGNSDDSPALHGGGAIISSGRATIRACTFLRNTAWNGGGLSVHNAWEGGILIAECGFIENRATHGGGALEMFDVHARLLDCVFGRNTAEGYLGGGGALLNAGGYRFSGCIFEHNTAKLPGGDGGGLDSINSLVQLDGCIFRGNHSARKGGAIYFGGSIGYLANCSLTGNAAVTSGGALLCNASDINIANCTFSLNAAPDASALVCHPPNPSVFGTVHVGNSILWDAGAEIIDADGYVLTVAYTNVQGGWPGEGNLDAAPRFVGPLGLDGSAGTEDDNLRLRWDSPCIDAGDNSSVPAEVFTDLDGRPRFIDDPDTPDTGLGTPPIVDMGAYEFPGRAGDFDGDGDVDLNDFATFALCYQGAEVPPAPGCEPCDLDTDNDVDLADFATFAANFTG